MRRTQSLDAAYFDDLYAMDPDPWKFASSPYEQAKYARTIAALGAERAASALEMGCSIGILTEHLAAFCDHLVATEISQPALIQAQNRCAALDNVEFRLLSLPNEAFDRSVDLIVLSEIVYYWDSTDLQKAAKMIDHHLAAKGRLLLVHWLGETDYPKSGGAAVEELYTYLSPLITVEKAERYPEYRLDLWRRV